MGKRGKTGRLGKKAKINIVAVRWVVAVSEVKMGTSNGSKKSKMGNGSNNNYRKSSKRTR